MKLTKPYSSNSAKETSQRISADGDALDVRCLARGGGRAGAFDIDLWEIFEEAGQGE